MFLMLQDASLMVCV